MPPRPKPKPVIAPIASTGGAVRPPQATPTRTAGDALRQPGTGGRIITGPGGTTPVVPGSAGAAGEAAQAAKQATNAGMLRGRTPGAAAAGMSDKTRAGGAATGGGAAQYFDPKAPTTSTGAAGSAPTAQAGQTGENLSELAQMRADQEKERQAQEGELRRIREQALADASARSGLGGFGLSGGSAALQSDIGRTQARTAAVARADLQRKQRDEQWQAQQREIALNDLEQAQDEDLDDDGLIGGEKVGGKIGDGDTENNPKTADEQGAAAVAALGGDGGDFTPFTGSIDAAYALRDQDPPITMNADDARIESDFGGGSYYLVVRGSDGKLYKFSISKKQATSGDQTGSGYDRGRRLMESLGL